jgi:prepilin-type N-terminal cleavage/methylation domain-containing protein/prepilin-type processing-associated H-X9-DG protein
MTSQPNNTRKRAFTLIELLTVIAIIGILAAIIIPTVGSVRNKAKGVRCSSNLRQIGIAIRVFANDNNGMMVPYRGEPSSSTAGAQNWLWTEYLIPYMNIKADRLPALPAGADYKEDSTFFYMCPSSPVPVNWRAWGNYVLHPVIMKSTGSSKPNFAISKVQRPSQVIIIADGSVRTDTGLEGGSTDTGAGQFFDKTYPFTSDPSNILNAPVAAENSNPNADGTTGWLRYRHNNTVNCLFLDGHVKGIPYADRSKEVTYSKFVISR